MRVDEREGIELALSMARPGDLVVIFADDVTRTWKQVIYWGKSQERRSAPPSEAASPELAARPFLVEAQDEAVRA